MVGAKGVFPWACQHCTYLNDVDRKTTSSVCEVCEAPRYDASDDDFEAQAPAPARAPKPTVKRRRKSKEAKLPASRRRLGRADPMTQRPVEDEEYAEVDAEAVDNMALKPPLPEAKPPIEVTMPLLPFQRESLGWMQAQEAGPIKGGILADEMGMGKTIQAITLIVANLPTKPAGETGGTRMTPTGSDNATSMADGASSDDFEDVEVVRTVTAAQRAHAARMDAIDLQEGDHSPGSHVAARIPTATAAAPPSAVTSTTAAAGKTAQSRTTLVICPVAALMQWKHEIEKHVAPGTLRVYLYHGPKRTKNPEELAEVRPKCYPLAPCHYIHFVTSLQTQCIRAHGCVQLQNSVQ